jgi:Planctomycete cytochrome C
MRKISALIFTSISAAMLLFACSPEKNVSYKATIKPIIDKHCTECHLEGGQGALTTGFRMDSYENLMKGTKFGPVIVAGDSLSSSLYRLVSGKVDKSIRMPHSKDPMPASEISAIEKWIDQGAQNN